MVRGSIDIGTYVAIGDSVTSGYSDGALYYDAQLTAYPNLLASRFKAYGGNGFKQALLSEDSVGIGFYGNSRMVIRNDESTNTTGLSFLTQYGDLGALSRNLFGEQGPFHNMGVPGLKAITAVMPGYGNPGNGEGNFNPFFTRIASDPQRSSVLEDALALDPTFFTLFLGNNDVLAYAMSGGTMDEITPPFPDNNVFNFEDIILTMVSALTAKGAKGAIACLPDIKQIPFFTAIPYNGLRIDREKAEVLTKRYAAHIHYKEGNNPFLLETSKGVQLLQRNDLVLMDVLFDPYREAYLTGEMPIPKKYVLLEKEVLKIQQTITDYNSILESIARTKYLAFVNTTQLIRNLETDRIYSDRTHSLCFQKKRVFSLDGLHLNPLGQALLANAFIQSINTTYGSDIPKINLMKYRRMTETG